MRAGAVCRGPEPGRAGWWMEEAKGPSGSLMAGHGPENWLSRWERQCLDEDERQGLLPESGAETDPQRQRLWLSFQNSAGAVAQLYKGGGRGEAGGEGRRGGLRVGEGG